LDRKKKKRKKENDLHIAGNHNKSAIPKRIEYGSQGGRLKQANFRVSACIVQSTINTMKLATSVG
jgi:hypothetical protein